MASMKWRNESDEQRIRTGTIPRRGMVPVWPTPKCPQMIPSPVPPLRIKKCMPIPPIFPRLISRLPSREIRTSERPKCAQPNIHPANLSSIFVIDKKGRKAEGVFDKDGIPLGFPRIHPSLPPYSVGGFFPATNSPRAPQYINWALMPKSSSVPSSSYSIAISAHAPNLSHQLMTTTTRDLPQMEAAASVADDYSDDTYLSQLTDDEYIDFVANFLKPTPIEWVFVAIFLALMMVGICGNCLVVYVVSRNKHMWTSMNLFLTNLALSDLLVLVFCLPPTVLNDITKTFWLSEGFCKAMLFVQNTSVYVSVLTLVAISLERWKAISKPLSRALPSRRTCQVIGLIWLVAALLSLPEPFTLRTFPAEYARKNLSTKWGTRCKESWSPEFQQKYQLIQTVALFITPLMVISALCVHMNIVLRQKALQIGERHLRERQRAMRMLTVVVFVFALSYMPVHLHNIATSFQLNWDGEEEEPSLILIALRKFVPRVMSYSSSVINPITYNFMSEKFRKEFRRACCCGGRKELLKKESLCRRPSSFSPAHRHLSLSRRMTALSHSSAQML